MYEVSEVKTGGSILFYTVLVEDTGKEQECEESRSEQTDGGTSAEIDPYSYVNRDEFTSEIYKVEVYNLPKYFGITVSSLFLESGK